MKKLFLLLQALTVFGILFPWRAAVEKMEERDIPALLGAAFLTVAASTITGMVILLVLGEATGLNRHIHAGMASQYENTIHSVASKHSAPINLKATMLKEGHRCASPVRRFSGGEAAYCVSPIGHSQFLPAKPGYRIACCTEVVIGSDQEILAGVRRLHAKAQRGVDNGLISYFIWSAALVALVTVVPVLLVIGIRVLIWTPLSMITVFVRTSLHGLRNLPRVLKAPLLTKVIFDGNAPAALVVCQLSDLHLVGLESLPVEHQTDPQSWLTSSWGPLTGRSVQDRAARALQIAKDLSPPAVLVTGDITDRGLESEWGVWRCAVERAGPWTTTALLSVPGNHDLTFSPPEEPDPRCSHYSERLNLYHANTGDGEHTTFPQLYELKLQLHGAEQVGLVLLNSNEYRSQHLLSGALGNFGPAQLKSLERLLSCRSGPLLIAMHHHLGPIAQEGLSFSDSIQDRFMLCLDGKEVLDILRNYSCTSKRNTVMIVHGHRHRLSMATDSSGTIKILGLPSSTLGMHQHLKKISIIDGIQRIAAISITNDLQWQVRIIEIESE